MSAPALEVGGIRQDQVGPVRHLGIHDVRAGVERDQGLVGEHAGGRRAALRPRHRGDDRVAQVDVELGAALLEVVVHDLAHLHLLPAVRQRPLGRIFEVGAERGLRRRGLRHGIPGRRQLFLEPVAIAARLADGADERVEHDDGALIVEAVVVRARAAVGERGDGRARARELDRDALDVGGRHARLRLRPRRRAIGEPGAQPRFAGLHEVLDEGAVVQVLAQDHVGHRQRDRALGAGMRLEPLVAAARRVRHAHVERHELGAVVEAGLDDAFHQVQAALVRFVEIGAEVQEVAATLGVDRFPVRLAQAHVIGRALVRRAQGAVVQQHRRADRVQEARELGRVARAALVDRHALRVPVGDALADARRDLVVRFVPRDALPQALAPLAHALEGIQQAFRVGVDRGAALALRARHEVAEVRVERIAADLDDLAVLDEALDAAHGGAVQAHAFHRPGRAVVDLPLARRAVGRDRVVKRLGHARAGIAGRQQDGLADGQRGQCPESGLEKMAALHHLPPFALAALAGALPTTVP